MLAVSFREGFFPRPRNMFINLGFSMEIEATSMENERILIPKMEVFASDDSPFQFFLMFRFQPLIFRVVRLTAPRYLPRN